MIKSLVTRARVQLKDFARKLGNEIYLVFKAYLFSDFKMFDNSNAKEWDGEEMHDDMHVLYFYGIVTSSQVMPTMMKKISNTVHTIALVSGAMGAPFFCRLYQMHLFGDHQLIANMSSFQTDSFNVMQNIIGSAPLLMRMSGYDRDFTAFSTDGHLFQAR